MQEKGPAHELTAAGFFWVPDAVGVSLQRSMKLAVIEIDYHAEVLRNLCEGLSGSGVETTVFCTTSIAKAVGPPAQFPDIRWETPSEQESVPAFITRNLEQINTCDAIFFNTLATHFQFFAQIDFKPPVILRLHNASTYLQNHPPYKPIFTPFFLFKDASHFVRKVLGENEPRWRKAFVQTVNYFCFPDSALEHSVRKAGWMEGRTSLDPLPFTLHASGFEKEPEPSQRNITIIGSLDPRRRNYGAVLDAFGLLIPELQQSCTLTLLGRPRGAYGNRLLRDFEALQRPGFTVKSYRAFVPQEEFERVIRQTDFLIIPALERTRYTIYTEYYGKTKISGNIYDMIRYGKPAIIPKHYALDPDVNKMTARYAKSSDLARLIINWIEGEGLKTHLAAVPEAVARFQPQTVRAEMARVFGLLR